MTKVNVTDIVTDGATLSPISDMDIDMAADVAADVAFFFKLGHYNGPFFNPLYFLAQTQTIYMDPKKSSPSNFNNSSPFFKITITAQNKPYNSCKKYIAILFTQQIEQELSFYFTSLIFL